MMYTLFCAVDILFFSNQAFILVVWCIICVRNFEFLRTYIYKRPSACGGAYALLIYFMIAALLEPLYHFDGAINLFCFAFGK